MGYFQDYEPNDNTSNLWKECEGDRSIKVLFRFIYAALVFMFQA
jgi:hypothetical protein